MGLGAYELPIDTDGWLNACSSNAAAFAEALNELLDGLYEACDANASGARP